MTARAGSVSAVLLPVHSPRDSAGVLPRATLAFGGGYAGIRYDEPVFFIDTDADGSYLNGEVRYYLTDDFAVSIGGMRSLGNDLGFASVEYQMPVAGLSFFATSANGDNGYDHTLA